MNQTNVQNMLQLLEKIEACGELTIDHKIVQFATKYFRSLFLF